MNFETIRLATDDRGVATLTLARPERHNALSAAMIAELAQAAALLGGDPAVRVVVLAAEGESFCAGADLGWMKEQFAAPRTQRMEEARRLARMLNALYSLPKPLIGRVQGQAFGGGIGMISVCDVAIAAHGARFALTETRLGLIPATIGPYVVARIGHADARRVFMSGRFFDAAEAAALRSGEWRGRCRPARCGDRGRGDALSRRPRPAQWPPPRTCCTDLGPNIDDAVIDMTIARLADVWETPEAREGVAAFFEKRPPQWRR